MTEKTPNIPHHLRCRNLELEELKKIFNNKWPENIDKTRGKGVDCLRVNELTRKPYELRLVGGIHMFYQKDFEG